MLVTTTQDADFEIEINTSRSLIASMRKVSIKKIFYLLFNYMNSLNLEVQIENLGYYMYMAENLKKE